MSIFIDLWYPGNPERKKRMEELTNDCQLFINDTADKKEQISTAVAKTNEIIKKAYESAAKTAPALKKISLISKEGMMISEGIAGIITIPIAMSVVKWAFSTYLLRAGKITAQEIIEVGAASLIKINIGSFWRFTGNAGAAIVIMLVFEAILDSVWGAVQREKMCTAIQKIVPQRVNIKKSLMINEAVYLSCLSALTAYEVYVKIGTLAPSMLDEIAKAIVEQNKVEIDKITDAMVREKLRQLDANRGSWTKEDTASNGALCASRAPQSCCVEEDLISAPQVLTEVDRKSQANNMAQKIFSNLSGLSAEQKQQATTILKEGV